MECQCDGPKGSKQPLSVMTACSELAREAAYKGANVTSEFLGIRLWSTISDPDQQTNA